MLNPRSNYTESSHWLAPENLEYYFLKQIVEINSQSRNVFGVSQVQKKIEEKLLSLKFNITKIENQCYDSAHLLVGKLNAENTRARISLIAHADTVLGPNEENYYRQEGDFLLGPGIADNKGGLFVALKGLSYYLNEVESNFLDINFISSPNEELGSPGFHHLFNEIGQNTDIALGFEPSMEDGSIIESRNGNRWYKLEVIGDTGHSGRSVKGHMNAAHDLCMKINHLVSETLNIEGATLNVGEIKGGHSYNTICEKIYAKIDTRFNSFNAMRDLEKLFEDDFQYHKRQCVKSGKFSLTDINLEDDCPPMGINDKTQTILCRYKKAINDIENRRVESVHSGGAADINHFCHPSLIAFDGLGPIAANMHRRDEYIVKQSLETRALALKNFLLELNNDFKSEY
jgi:glutamate carboxypeptidase